LRATLQDLAIGFDRRGLFIVLTARVFECCFCLFNRSFSPGANLGSCYLLLLTLQLAPALFFF
jgi:hypothetical protein